MEVDAYFGPNVKAVREARGLTQAELATLADVGANHITKVEGELRRTSLRNAAKIAQALRVSLDELLAEDILPVINRILLDRPQVVRKRRKR